MPIQGESSPFVGTPRGCGPKWDAIHASFASCIGIPTSLRRALAHCTYPTSTRCLFSAAERRRHAPLSNLRFSGWPGRDRLAALAASRGRSAATAGILSRSRAPMDPVNGNLARAGYKQLKSAQRKAWSRRWPRRSFGRLLPAFSFGVSRRRGRAGSWSRRDPGRWRRCRWAPQSAPRSWPGSDGRCPAGPRGR